MCAPFFWHIHVNILHLLPKKLKADVGGIPRVEHLKGLAQAKVFKKSVILF